jgi:hypothetical protein
MRSKHWFYVVPLWLRSLFRWEKVEGELDEELRYHLEQKLQANLAKGMSAEQARRAALREFGGVEQSKQACRDQRKASFLQDTVRGLRLLVSGLVIGIAFSMARARVTSNLVYGVSAWDLTAFAGVPMLLTGVALHSSAARLAGRSGRCAALRMIATGDCCPGLGKFADVKLSCLPAAGWLCPYKFI